MPCRATFSLEGATHHRVQFDTHRVCLVLLLCPLHKVQRVPDYSWGSGTVTFTLGMFPLGVRQLLRASVDWTKGREPGAGALPMVHDRGFPPLTSLTQPSSLEWETKSRTTAPKKVATKARYLELLGLLESHVKA